MFYRKLLLGLVAGGFLAGGSALAQNALVEIDDDVQVAPFGVDADTVDDWDVYDASGTEIGEVENVVGTDAKTPTALAVDFEGNGGYADRDVVVPLGEFTRQDGRLILNASPDAVRGMPTWDD
jgi:hypothetical protein